MERKVFTIDHNVGATGLYVEIYRAHSVQYITYSKTIKITYIAILLNVT